MTTIAWDGKTLAADREAGYGSIKFATQKLRQVADFMFAGAGAAEDIDAMARWLANGADPKERLGLSESVLALAVDISSGQPFIICGKEMPSFRKLRAKQMAIGCGSDFVLACMVLGKTAPQAIRLAEKHISGTGLGVDSYTVKRSKK